MNVFIWNRRNTQGSHLELTTNTLLGIQLLQFKSTKFKVFCKWYFWWGCLLQQCAVIGLPKCYLILSERRLLLCGLFPFVLQTVETHFIHKKGFIKPSTYSSWNRGTEFTGVYSLALFTKHIIAPVYGLNIDSSRFRKHSRLFYDIWTKPEWLKYMESGCKTVIDQTISIWQRGGRMKDAW